MAYLSLISLVFCFSIKAASIKFSDGENNIFSYSKSSFSRNSIKTYNQNRKHKRRYKGNYLDVILDKAYGKNWKEKRKIVFVALDRYKVMYSIKRFLEVNNEHRAFIAYSEHGMSGFTSLKNKGKKVDPGPFVLVWENVKNSTPKDVVKFKYPYQIYKIILK